MPYTPPAPGGCGGSVHTTPATPRGAGGAVGVVVSERCSPIDVVTCVCPVTVQPRGKWPATEGKAGGGHVFLQFGGSGTALVWAAGGPTGPRSGA